MHLDGVDQIDLSIVIFTNVYRQEEEDEQAAAEEEAAGTGEDLCHPSAYNRRLRSYAVS